MKFFIVLISFFVTAASLAHKYKSQDFCSSITTDICAHIGFNQQPSTSKAFEFTFDVVNKVKAQELTNVSIEAFSISSNGEPIIYKVISRMRPDGHHWDSQTEQVPFDIIRFVRMTYQYQGQLEEIVVELP
jgi:hypothetical protein